VNTIKTYNNVNRANPQRHFGISKMEDIYHRRKGEVDVPHRHDYYTIILTHQALGKHSIDFHEFDLKDKQVYFLSPGQVHQIVEEKASVGFSIVFSTQFLIENNIPIHFVEDLNLFNDYGYCPPLEISESYYQQLARYCGEMITYYSSKEQFKTQAIGALLLLFLIRCNNFCTQPPSLALPNERNSQLLKTFKSLVDQHYQEWHTATEYAQAMHLSPDHLSRTIKSLIGKTSKEYIQSRITIAAKRMLFFSDRSAKEIGYQLGFSEPANFSAFFKKFTGSSPTQFRKKMH